MEEPVFYAYAAPEPEGFAKARVEPPAARYAESFHEFFLPYESVRTARDREAALTSFLESTYEAAAKLADWPREALEREAR
jgi:hypothetical protein